MRGDFECVPDRVGRAGAVGCEDREILRILSCWTECNRISHTESIRRSSHPVNIRAIYDDEDNSTVIVLWDGQGTTTAGTTYRNTYAWFMTLRGGQVIDGTAFYDSIAFNELWENVTP